MAEPHTPLDDRLSMLERALADVDLRLRALESGQAASAPAALPPGDVGVLPVPRIDIAGTSALTGRAFVLLAGAYLLRALTESGVLDRVTGAALGLVYALALAVLADRVATRQRASASFLGGCAVLISLPLIWEITVRFELVSPVMSAPMIACAVAIILAVAWRRDLHALAWVATAGACVLAGALLTVTGVPLPFAWFLVALGIVTLWLGYDRGWIGLRWLVALFANFSIVALIARALASPPREAPESVLAIVIASLLGYLGSIAIRTLWRKRDVLPFEVVQTAVLLTVGVAGAVLIARETGSGAQVLGPTLLLLSVAAYTVAFIHREMNARAANYYFYTTLALVLAVISGNYMFDGAPAAVVWTMLAVGMGWLGRRFGRITLHAHAIVYLLVGASMTGLLVTTLAALFASAASAPVAAPIYAWLLGAAVLICWQLSMPPGAVSALTRVPRIILMLVLVIVAAGACVIAGRTLLSPLLDASRFAALIATERTATFATGAILVAWLGTRASTREFGWLLYPLLGWGLVKLLFEDLRVSPPSFLFVALALYGAALIVAPRLVKSASATS